MLFGPGGPRAEKLEVLVQALGDVIQRLLPVGSWGPRIRSPYQQCYSTSTIVTNIIISISLSVFIAIISSYYCYYYTELRISGVRLGLTGCRNKGTATE